MLTGKSDEQHERKRIRKYDEEKIEDGKLSPSKAINTINLIILINDWQNHEIYLFTRVTEINCP